MKSPAPIALFVYRRPAATRRVLESLFACRGLDECRLHVYSDGPRDATDDGDVAATREVVRAFQRPGMRLVERAHNRGLAESIIAGVDELCGESGAAIVIEDDLVLGPEFLTFMNRGLARFEADERVFQINGYVYPADLSQANDDAFFLPIVGTWGWATWSRAWARFDRQAGASASVLANPETARAFDLDGAFPFARMLRRQLAGEIDSWAIRYYLSMFECRGLALYPSRPLVANLGLGRGATHTRWSDAALRTTPYTGRLDRMPADVVVDPVLLASIQKFLRRYQNPVAKFLRRLRGLLPSPADS